MKENGKAAKVRAAFDATVATVKEVVEESKEFNRKEAERNTAKKSEPIPVQAPMPAMLPENQLRMRLCAQWECCQASSYIFKALKDLPDCFNIVQPDNVISLPVWKNWNGTFGIRLFKKDSGRRISHSMFSNSIKPELQRRAQLVATNARNEIRQASFNCENKKKILKMKYSSPFFVEYYTDKMILDFQCEELELEKNTVISENYFMTSELIFFGHQDRGDYIDVFFHILYT